MDHPTLSDNDGLLVVGDHPDVSHLQVNDPPLWSDSLLNLAVVTSPGLLRFSMFDVDVTQAEVADHANADVRDSWQYPTPAHTGLATQGTCTDMPNTQAATANSTPSAVSRDRTAPAAEASHQDAGVVSTNITVAQPVKTKKKRFEIIGVQLLSIQCDGRNYIRLGRLLDEDLHAFAGSALRDFYDDFGEKVSYVIVLGDNLRYSKQMRCRQNKNSKTPLLYFTHERIVRDVVKVTKSFLKTHLDFHVHPAFYGWPIDATIDNFALVELRKMTRASVEIVFQYCSSN